jgi:hypothetical protein
VCPSNANQALMLIERSRVLTLKEATAYLQISKAHLSNILHWKVPGVPVLKHARVGRRILIRQTWADEWLEQTGHRSLINKC